MRKILFAVHFNENDAEAALYLDTFRKQGFTLVNAKQESLLLRADAVLLYNDGSELSETDIQLLDTAVQRSIPVVSVHTGLTEEKTAALLAGAEVIDAGKVSFAQLKEIIHENQQDIYVTPEPVKKNTGWINILFLVLGALLMCFLIWRITEISREQETDVQNEKETVSDSLRNAVVRVYSISSFGAEVWRGSGFTVAPEGYIVTNAHVVDHAASRYRVIYREQTYDAEVISVSDSQDIALLKADVPAHTWLVFEKEKPEKGDTVYAAGYPGDQKLTVLSGTFNDLTAVFENGLRYSSITMPLKGGISGSPVVNSEGKVVGIASAVSVSDENAAWMVDSDTAMDFLKNYLFLPE